MNEKKLLKLIEETFNKSEGCKFTEKKDVKLIQALLAKDVLEIKAFKFIDAIQEPNAECYQLQNINPFTKYGIEYIERSLYFRVRESKFVKISMDVGLLLSFILSITQTIRNCKENINLENIKNPLICIKEYFYKD